MSEPVIKVLSLTKSYGKFLAVDNIGFDVQPGEIFGLLGPNGAGKTTTLECLEGLRLPDKGDIRIMGVDPVRNVRRLHNTIGVQLQTSGLPASMTVGEAMRFFCAYHGVAPRYDLLDRLGLKEKTGAQYHTLSTGLQRRLALALSLAHQPPIIIMDEPTAGLDVPSRVELHELMNELRSRGTTILLATHDMAEAEKMADRVAILLRGKIVVAGTPRELTATGSALTKVTVSTVKNSLLLQELTLPGAQRRLVQDEYLVCFSFDVGHTLKAILAHIEEHDDAIIDLRVERPSLEERFLEITTEKAR
jgi:ABC-2 type transport system ATP-binding protein